MNFNIDPLFVLMFIIMCVACFFGRLDVAMLVGLVGNGLLINKLFTQLKTIRQSLSRWELVVGKFESALGSPMDQAKQQ